MAGHAPHSKPAGKSKTALRRGDFNVGHPAPCKTQAHPYGQATTDAEQAFLFEIPPTPKPVETNRHEA
jgi:hypothetical protein